MSVIRPENANRDGNVPAPTSVLTASLRRLATDRADEKSRLDERRDEARPEGAQATCDASRLTNLLFRAGVGDTSGTINGGSAAKQVTNDSVVKLAAKAEELNLGPVTPPKNELTLRLSESAHSFASNLDKVVTNHLTLLRSALTADQANNHVLAHPVRLDERAAQVGERGLARLVDGGRDPTGRFLLANSTTPAMSDGEMARRLQLQDLSKLSSDQLLSEFLKLNINDPNANVETQNKLYELASQMRKLAIEEAKARIKRAQELMKEAQKMADRAEKYADMAGIIGIAAAFMGPLGAILSGIIQIVVAVMQYQAQMKMLDAKTEKNNAERFKLMGDMHQNQVEETGDVINKIMELKNQMVDSVIQMINASFSTQQQLMSASMAR